MFASLAGTTDFVAVKVEFATGDGFSFPFGHFGVFSWRSSQISLALTEKRSMRDGYGSQQAELTYIYIYTGSMIMIIYKYVLVYIYCTYFGMMTPYWFRISYPIELLLCICTIIRMYPL